jgi:hypothetical protein
MGGRPIFALPKTMRRVRLRARTPPFHGGDTGSNPVRGTGKASQKCEAFLLVADAAENGSYCILYGYGLKFRK